MPTEISAGDVSELVRNGHDRVKQYRGAARDAIKEFCGNYYTRAAGMTGESPINLLFIALRTWVPNLAARSGVNRVITDVLAQADYAHLLGLSLDHLHRKIHMRDMIRAGIVNMILTGIAIFKTSLEATDNLLPVGDNKYVDPGQIYTDLVSLDDFFFDAHCLELKHATMLGHFVTVRRQVLLDQEGWDHDLVLRLSSANSEANQEETAKSITQESLHRNKMIEMQDYVRVAEIYFPEAQMIAYVPDPRQSTFDDYLKIMDYYGPSTGPYRFGSLTPPVPDNPFPIAPVSMWRDLNAMANQIFIKLMDQADRQKDVLLFKPGMEDVADAVANALDGGTIRTSDPDGVKIASYGGGNPDNDKMVQVLMSQFNYVAGNPDQASGAKVPQGAKTATAQSILQSNASVTQEDAKSLIYDLQSGISGDQGWYMMHDPLINQKLISRDSGGDQVQVTLTPEQRIGAYESLTFKITKRSMQELDPQVRRKAILDFSINIVPGIMNAAIVANQAGVPFDAEDFVMTVAEEMGIADIAIKMFNASKFNTRMQQIQQLGPEQTSKGLPTGDVQNNGNPLARPVADAGQQMNQQAQGVAAEAQSMNQGVV